MRKHNGEKPYQCSYCDMSFKQISDIQLHMEAHICDNPYFCKHCGKVFMDNCNLKAHFLTHGKGKNNFQYSYCDKAFIFNAKL